MDEPQLPGTVEEPRPHDGANGEASDAVLPLLDSTGKSLVTRTPSSGRNSRRMSRSTTLPATSLQPSPHALKHEESFNLARQMQGRAVPLVEVEAALRQQDVTAFEELFQQLQNLEAMREQKIIKPDEVELFDRVVSMLETRMQTVRARITAAIQMKRVASGKGDALLHDDELPPMSPGGTDPGDASRMNRVESYLERHEEEIDLKLRALREVAEQYGQHDARLERLQSVRVLNMKGAFRHPHMMHKPRLRQFWKDDGAILVRDPREHKASWNELFFDLVFVVVLAHLGTDYEHYLNMGALFEFVVLFMAVWRTWTSATTYINRFNPTDGLHKLYYFFEMVFVMGMVIHTVNGTAGSYICARLTTEVFSLWSAIYEPKFRRTAVADFSTFLAGIIPWIISLNVIENENTAEDGEAARPDDWHLVLWLIGLAVEVIGDIIISLFGKTRVPFNIEHVTERFGLFTVIMLGETLVALLFDAETATWKTYMNAFFFGLNVICVQTVYFDVLASQKKKHALVKGGVAGALWYVVHLPLQASIVLSAASLKALFLASIESHKMFKGFDNDQIQFARRTLGTAEGVAWASLGLISMLHTHTNTRWLGRFPLPPALFSVSAVSVGVSMINNSDLSLHAMLGCLAASSFIAAIYALYGHVATDHHPNAERHKQETLAASTAALKVASSPQSRVVRYETQMKSCYSYDTAGQRPSRVLGTAVATNLT